MLRKFHAPVAAAVSILILSAAPPPARADLSYTLTAHIHAKHVLFGITPVVRATFYFQGQQERVDSSLIIPVMGSHTSVISDCAAGKVYSLDTVTGDYAVSDNTAFSPDPFGITAMMGGFADVGKEAKPSAPSTPPVQAGTVTVNVKVADKGIVFVNGAKTHDWIVKMTPTATGNVTADIGPPKVEVWTDDTPLPISCVMERALDAGSSGRAAPTQPASVQYSFTGDVDALRALLSYAPVRLQFVAEKQKLTINFERSKLSSAPLDSKLFQPASIENTGSTPAAAEDKAGVSSDPASSANPSALP